MYFRESQLTEVEKFVRLHYDLDINVEGIEAIGHLLEKLEAIQARNRQLQNRLGLYENKNEGL
jgi:chaperone modulatory protein CbpM